MGTKLRPLQKHAFELARYLALPDIDHVEVANWLEIASAIRSINYRSELHNTAALVGGPELDYENRKSEITAPYLFNLTVFAFIWSGFECYVNRILSQSHIKKYGKVNAVTQMIKSGFGDEFPFQDFERFSLMFRTLLEQSTLKRYLTTVKAGENVGLSGQSLQLIYKIRNEFAHGELIFPEPGQAELALTEIIACSSRLVLFYLQACLTIEDKEELIQISWHFPELKQDWMKAAHLVNQIHLEL